MDLTEIKFGKTATVAPSSQNLFTITSAAKTANSIKTFLCFGMTWQIQVEVTLAPVTIQGRWCYEWQLDHDFLNRLLSACMK